MNIFLTGGTGVIGRRTIPALVDAGHDVTAIARTDAKAEQVRAAGGRAVLVDLFDPTAVKDAVEGHDAVINLATHIPPTRQALRSKAWHENDRIRVEGSTNLVEAAMATGASRFVQESLAFLYEDHGDRWIDEDEPFIDCSFTGPITTAEGNVGRFTEAGGQGTVLRFGMFYGPGSAHTDDLLRLARRGWLAMPGRPDGYFSMIDTGDAAAAVVAALSAPAGTYNVVEDDPLTRADMATALASALGRRKVRPAPRLVSRVTARTAPNLVGSQRVSNRRFRTASPWTCRRPNVRTGVPELLAALEGSTA